MIEFQFENISDCVFHHAERQPEAPALINSRETVSYGMLATLVGQAAVYLSAKGVTAGDRVGIVMTNTVERVVLSLAIMRIGAALIELPMDITAPNLAAYITRFAMSATIVDGGGPGSSAQIPISINLQWRDDLARLSGNARYNGNQNDLQIVILSSGSTGLPKGIVTTHQQRICRSSIHANAAGFWVQDKLGTLLLAAPASTGLVAQFLTTQLLLGGATKLMPTFRYTIDLVREIAACDDAIFPVPPIIARSFINYAAKPAALFPKMRALAVSGQPLPSHDKVTMVELLTPNLYDVYGSAAFGMISCLRPSEITRQLNSVGRPVSLPGVEIEIAGADGAPAPAGGLGELRVRGPSTSIGFFNGEDNARGNERFANGWYYPGEIASIDKSGYLSLKGRIADAINIGSQTVYPPEIEEIITQHPHVVEAAIIGRPGVDGVDEMVAFVVGRPGFRKDDIDAHCRKQLPPSKRPKFIYYLERMPKLSNGKIDRPALKSQTVRLPMR